LILFIDNNDPVNQFYSKELTFRFLFLFLVDDNDRKNFPKKKMLIERILPWLVFSIHGGWISHSEARNDMFFLKKKWNWLNYPLLTTNSKLYNWVYSKMQVGVGLLTYSFMFLGGSKLRPL